MKRLLTFTFLLLFGLTTPIAALAQSPVQRLKDPGMKFAEHRLLVEEIVDQGTQSVPELIALLKEKTPVGSLSEAHRHWGAKVTAMNILSELRTTASLGVLKDMLETSDSISAINNSARAIGNIGGAGAYKIIEGVYLAASSLRYPDDNEERKQAVIVAMGLCENKKAIPCLVREMNNPNNDEVTRIYAAGSLGMLGIDSGVDVASAGLTSNDEYVRMAAIRALGVIGSTSSLPALNDLNTPRTAYVFRKNVNVSMIQIQAGQMADDEKVDYIRHQLINDPATNELVHWGTLKLKKINTSKAKKALQDLSAQDAPQFEGLKHVAKIRLKTMN